MQFTIRTLLIWIIAIPGTAGLLVIGTMTVLFVPASVATIVYGRGYWRAFAVGAAVPAGALALLLSGQYMPSVVFAMFFEGGELEEEAYQSLKMICAFESMLMASSGLVGAAVRFAFSQADTESTGDAKAALVSLE